MLLLAGGCSSTTLYVAEDDSDWREFEPSSSATEEYRVFLVGDVGGVDASGNNPVLETLRQELNAWGEQGAVVFLGDNLYCCGLPDSSSQEREKAEQRLVTILESVDDFPGRIIFVPGNHDWNNSNVGGLEALHRQEAFIESYLSRGNTFMPDGGFPGPAEVDLTDDITLLAIDTEWWLSRHEKSFGDDGNNEIIEEADFFLELQEEVSKQEDKLLLVVGHHPLHSNGTHAGYFPRRQHIFPLTALWKNAYVPLPILGSIPLLITRYFGASRQDLGHRRYRQLRSALTRIFGQHENLIYASGHEHNLQYFRQGSFLHPQHHVVSGSASRTETVAAGHDAVFAADVLGYSTIHYYDDRSVWLAFWRTDASMPGSPSLIFRTRIKAPPATPTSIPATTDSETGTYPDYADSVKVLAVSPSLKAGPLKKLFLGSHNRDLWTTPVEARFLDMGSTAGGLTPIKRGGGLQTTSIRMRGGDGKEYVLRSLDKDPTRSIPPSLENTVAVDIVLDQVASINPFGAYVIPPMAKAIGMFHTEPTLVYVPDDPRLGPFRELTAGRLMMLEDRPRGDVSDVERYGRSENVVSAAKMYESINDDNDDFVDQQAFVKARLFDMLISDWDRHRGQWRWASFDNEDKGKRYVPIPRDRDWAFNKMNGLFPSLARYFDPKFQDFEHNFKSIKGLTRNGLEQDRRFTSQLTRADWMYAARHIQESLTDDVIRDAVRQLPDTIHALVGAEMVEKLISRRNQLDKASSRYYELLAETVDVVGSNKHERFEVRSPHPDTTEVTVYKTTKDGEIRKQIYHRLFSTNETEEIRLYGLSGNDRYDIQSVGTGIKVRALGGPGADVYRSDVSSRSLDLNVHDTWSGNTVEIASGKVKLTDDPAITSYRSGDYKHDATFPRAFFGSNPDDGIFIGGGIRFVTHGFKKSPFSTEQVVLGNVATRTGAFNLRYSGHFVRAVGRFDLLLDASVLTPNNIRNFYGLGNMTENEQDDREFYQARLSQVTVTPTLRISHPMGANLSIGTFLRVTNVEQDEDRFVSEPQAGISPSSFDDQWFSGARVSATLESVDSGSNPKQGFRLRSDFEANIGLRNAGVSYGKVASDLTVYLSPSLSPQLTIASRVGFDHTVGSFPFYDASTLGGSSNLRGYRSTRFAGRTAFYQNVEVRLRLFSFSAYLANGNAGVLGFFDNGRVWTEVDARNRVWHQGYGGGLWAHVLNALTLTTWIGASEDDLTYTLKFGFHY